MEFRKNLQDGFGTRSARDEYIVFYRWAKGNQRREFDRKTTIKTSEFPFMRVWGQSIVPICMQDSFNLPTDCADFSPSFTNEGLGFTRNGADLEKMYQTSNYIQDFKTTMLFNRSNPNLKYVKGSGINNQYVFLINTNRYKDLKRGIKWNQTEKSQVKLAIHSPLNVADVKNLGVKIYPGYLTTIRVDMVELVSNDNIRGLDIKKRQCRFNDESKNLEILSNYSNTNCLFECSMNFAETICGCRPWDYPRLRPLNSKPSRICDFFGSSCFNKMMKIDTTEEDCRISCDSDCEEVKYSLSVDRSPLESDDYICLNPKTRDKTEKNVQKSIWNSIFGETIDGNPISWFHLTNADRFVKIVQDALINPNKTTDQIDYCKEKVSSDIAVVEIIINSPTVLRLVQSVKVSFVEKLANFGKCLFY